MRTGKPSTQMEWRTVTNNVVIANYGGSKQVDNDDGSLFWRVHSNFMAYGWVSDSDAFSSCRGMRLANLGSVTAVPEVQVRRLQISTRLSRGLRV